jgi:hypothetical protein
MNTTINKYSVLSSELKDSDEFEFDEELKSIREKGDVEMIPVLVEFIEDETIDIHRRHKIAELLGDITTPSAREILIESVNKLRGKPALAMVVSSLWQSRLDFSQWLDIFVEIMFDEELYTAIEAITLIENSLEKLDENQKTELRNSIRDRIILCKDETRKFLILDMLNNLI